MPASETQKKVGYFLVSAMSLALILILYPFIEDWINASVAVQFGLSVSPDGAVTTASGKPPD